MSNVFTGQLGGRYRVRVTPDGQAPASKPKQESVLDFVAYFYSLIRDDPSIVRALDAALKGRYGK